MGLTEGNIMDQVFITIEWWAEVSNVVLGFTTVPANEACVPEDFIFLLFFTPQISEGIDDDSENQVENDNDNDEEEQ